MEVIKVRSNTGVTKLAGALANVIRKDGSTQMHCIGAGAVNQAVKAVATARGYLASSGIELAIIPSFKDVPKEADVKTAIVLQVRKDEL